MTFTRASRERVHSNLWSPSPNKEKCAFLRYFAASSGNSWPLKMAPTGCPKTSVRNYHYCLCNSAEECCSHLRGGSLNSCFSKEVWAPLIKTTWRRWQTNERVWSTCGVVQTGENRRTWKKPAPLPRCPLQITYRKQDYTYIHIQTVLGSDIASAMRSWLQHWWLRHMSSYKLQTVKPNEVLLRIFKRWDDDTPVL